MNMIINNSALAALSKLPNACIDMVFTSPSPIFFEHKNLERMTEDEKIQTVGTELNSYDYIIHLMDIFDEVKRVLKPQGSCFVNLADYYYDYGLEFIPWLFGLNMINEQKHGWKCVAQLSWHRPFNRNEIRHRHKKGFVKDIDYLFQFTHHSMDYDFNMQNNKLWKSSLIDYEVEQYPSNYFESNFPERMIEMCINLTVDKKPALILDPFAGSGTTGAVAKRLGHNYVMIDINKSYCEGMMIRLGDMEISR